MPGERTPNIPDPASNQMAFINFMADIKAKKKWMEDAERVIKRNEALLKTIGKASEIEKLHAQADDLKRAVLSEIALRERAIKDDRAKLNADMKARREKMAADEEAASRRATEAAGEVQAALATAKAEGAAAKKALADAAKALADAENQRQAVAALRTELANRAARVKELAAAV